MEMTQEKNLKLHDDVASCERLKMLKFFSMIHRLKNIKRAGWVRTNVSNPESVPDHMYRMAIMSMFIPSSSGVNKEHVMKLALIHDMAECIVGDITPYDKVPKEEKHQREREAMQKLSDLAGPEVGPELYSLWEEYEQQSSPESKWVKDLDRYEMIHQAFDYEKQENKPASLQEFFDCTKGTFQHDEIKKWVQELETQREAHIKQS
ncbi:HD domain-containing protein 2-like [Anneissia japonica]|uniref:HD domain-containing protein 2-like n=1 Tax=Anneissia japonica TaxID=1529436 RepID=UPI0014258494|nr:HD domain-containing protein 2-like [Anneissia japonica]